MYYSVIRVNGPIVVMEDPMGDVQVFSKDFFDYEVQENDLVYLENRMFHKAEEQTQQTQQENFEKMQNLFEKN